MPYRRLPNTDLARLRALRIAFEKGKELPPFKLAFSQAILHKISVNLHLFEKAVQESRYAYNNQVDKSKQHARLLKKARLYMSHFIQVTNMAIARGDLTPADRDYFGFGRDEKSVPSLSSESEVLKWGEKLISGESQRIRKGLTAISNPTIAVVKVRYENFRDANDLQKNLQRNLQRCLKNLIELRKTVDTIITSIWNEVEGHFKDLPDAEQRNQAKIYGVVYFFRKNEKPASP